VHIASKATPSSVAVEIKSIAVKAVPTSSAADTEVAQDKKAARAARFGLPPSEDDKKSARAARFGIETVEKSDKKSNGKKGKEPLVIDEELEARKRQRAERFGIQTQEITVRVPRYSHIFHHSQFYPFLSSFFFTVVCDFRYFHRLI